MTNSLKIHPSMKYHNRKSSLNLYEVNGKVKANFVYMNNKHIPGFYLFSITIQGLILDHRINCSMGIVELDLDDLNRESLKIIGVDLL